MPIFNLQSTIDNIQFLDLAILKKLNFQSKALQFFHEYLERLRESSFKHIVTLYNPFIHPGSPGYIIRFNGQKLLSGNFTDKSFQVGACSGETVTASFDSAEAAKLGDSANGQLSDINVLTQEGAQKAIRIADEALSQLNQNRSNIGSLQNQLESAIGNLATTQINVLSAQSAIQDVDVAEESMVLSNMKVLNKARVFASAQANKMNKENVFNLLQG